MNVEKLREGDTKQAQYQNQQMHIKCTEVYYTHCIPPTHFGHSWSSWGKCTAKYTHQILFHNFDVSVLCNAPPWRWPRMPKTCRRYTVCI